MDPVARLGQLLRDSGYAGHHHSALTAAGLPSSPILSALGRAEDARLATLVALFDAAWPVTSAAAAKAFDTIGVDELLDAGILESDGEEVRATARLFIYDDAIIAGDPLQASSRPDYVVAVSAAAMRMASVTVRRPVASALDLGTGSGIQALLAARHAEHVVAIDLNPHALEMARMGARFSGAENVEWVQGDWLEPVRGRRFDLVIATPPVIISPDNDFLWRDSPTGGEELSRRLVVECAEHLTEGGFATICCHWTHTEAAWSQAPAEWATGLGCDAVVLRFLSQEPLAYALGNLSERPDPDRAQVGEIAQRWMTHYRDAGVERIAIGAVVLRRRTADANWVRAFPLEDRRSAPGSDQLERIFAAGDALAGRAGAGGLAWRMAGTWRPLSGDRVDQAMVHAEGTYRSTGVALRREPGMTLAAPLDPRIVPVVVGCDGRRTLAQILGETPVPEGFESAEFHGVCLSTITELIARGLLVPEAA